MIGTRHEEYAHFENKLPFFLQIGIDYDRLQFSPFIRSEHLRQLLETLADTYLKTDAPLLTARLHAVLLEVLLTLSEHHAVMKDLPRANERVFENVKAAIYYIRENYARKITLEEIAKATYTDKFALCRDFKKLTGQTVVTYINHYRCQQAATFLHDGCTVAQTAGMCGFENLSFFTKTFKRHMGILPSKYKAD